MRRSLNRAIRILQLEANVADAERVQLHLFTTGLRCSIQRAGTREAFLASLHQYWPDVIVIGSDVPALDGAAALDIVRRESPHLPAVFAVMDRLEGLADVVQGALIQARAARARHIAEAAARHEQLRVTRAALIAGLTGGGAPCAEFSQFVDYHWTGEQPPWIALASP